MSNENSNNVNQLSRHIEDGNELLFYLEDVYEVLEYEPYKNMLTDSLLKIFFYPVVA